MITIPSLNNVTDILDTDMVMVTQASGQSYKIAGSEINKRGKIIIANSTTITGAPLKAGSSVRVYFTVDLTAANASTTLQLNYNNVNYYVKAPKDGTLINFVATNLGGSPAVYKYLQKYTTLELLFDGTQFVIIGNPVILSSADYTIYADGLQRVNTIENNNKGMVTSNAVYNSLLNKVNIGIRIGADFGTSELTLEKGVYLYVTNEHPLVNSRGLYLISVASTNTYNRVLTLISDSIVDSITISRDSTLFSVTSNSYFRGTLIKISDITAV